MLLICCIWITGCSVEQSDSQTSNETTQNDTTILDTSDEETSSESTTIDKTTEEKTTVEDTTAEKTIEEKTTVVDTTEAEPTTEESTTEPLPTEPPTGAVPPMLYSPDASYTGSDVQVPKIVITTNKNYGRTLIQATGYVDCSISITGTDGSVISEEKTAQVRVRGNSTSNGLKKPYNFKFSSKQNVLGLGEGKRWTLLADWFDPTLMRNYIAFDLAEHLNMNYTSKKQYVQVWMDGVYEGCYLLIEPVEKGKDRVDIDADDGDFLIMLEMEREEEGKTYFETDDGFRFVLKEPEHPTDEQLKYITDIANNVEKKINTGNYAIFSKVIDVESFAKYALLNDYIMTCDIAYSSSYFYYKDGIMYAGPIWDLDMSMGNSSNDMLGTSYNSRMNLCAFYYNLYENKKFMLEVSKLFNENKEYFEFISKKGGLIDQLVSRYQRLYDSNFTKTGYSLSQAGWAFGRPVDSTYQENVNYLRRWFAQRLGWYTYYMSTFE